MGEGGEGGRFNLSKSFGSTRAEAENKFHRYEKPSLGGVDKYIGGVDKYKGGVDKYKEEKV